MLNYRILLQFSWENKNFRAIRNFDVIYQKFN